jgi:NCS1 family nucleobase:cation symporter-1
MFLMFIAGAAAVFPRLVEAAGMQGVTSAGDFLSVARQTVWTGVTPDGSPPLGFWKVTAFAWICNLAMHGGLSDMALFRFARKSSYGLCSVFGMFLGHYLAWISAGIMGAGVALLLNRPLPELDPGEVSYQALGVAGILTVILAGWTTSNPTLYRAGLALQAVTPNWSRVRVTAAAGLITTVVACFPFVFTRLLDFVGIYGVLLAPVGAIVVTEHWIFPCIGFTRCWASHRKLSLNWPGLAAWGAAIVLALLLERTGTLHLFYLFLPVYLFTSVTYILLALGAGARTPFVETPSRPVTENAAGTAITAPLTLAARISGGIALCSLAACLAMVFLAAHDSLRTWLMVPTLVYFVSGVWFHRLTDRGVPAGH